MRILVLLAVLISGNLLSQPFLKNTSNRALTFKEIQIQFNQFKKTNDLSKTKHWKHFKRYEADMQLHTNGRGEPAGFSDYINEAIKVSEEKMQNASVSAPWFPVGPTAVPNNLTGYMENGIGRINCIAFHPTNASTFFVGVAQGGVWKTTNGGASYTCLTDNLPITRISDISIDPVNPNTMYISVCDFEYIGVGLYLNGRKRNTHYGLGVYKTTDGGLTWNPTGLTFQLTDGDASLMRKIVIDPSNTNQLLACGVSGMYRSTNGGTSWVKQMDSLFWDMTQDPVNPNIIYAATGWVMNSNMGYAGIYKSTNFGTSWTMLNTGIPMQGTVQRVKLAIAPSDNNYIYALTCNTSGGYYALYKSINAGSTWTTSPNALNILEAGQGTGTGGQGAYDLSLCVNGTNKNIIYTGGVNMWMSSDAGDNFNPVSHWTTQYGNTIHGDIHMIARQPGTTNYFVTSDGGVYKSNNIQPGDFIMNWPTVWTKLSNGMQVTSFYRLSSSKNSAGRLVAGAQDNATFYYDGISWSTIFGGDGMDNYLDPLNNQNILGSSQYGNFYYSNNNGSSGNYVSSNPNNESAEWVTPVAADYNNPGVVYLGNENVVKSTDGGQNWVALGAIYSNTTSLTNTEISALAVSKTNSNVIYAARRVRYEYGLNGIVFKSTNGGVSFTNITNNLPDTLYYTGIEASETNANDAVVCMAGFAAGCKVFRTTNGGSAWANISYNLPNIPVNCVKYVPGSGQIMVATDLGIYILNSGASTWMAYSTGLPNVITSDIEFNASLNKVYISTFGRGIWETNLNLVTGLQNNTKEQIIGFNVFPTVNSGKFTIEVNLELKIESVKVINVMGQVIYDNSLPQGGQELNLKLAPGNYYVKLEGKNSLGVKKIIVE
ncbi:MAG: T9SS type A sorting domain-containing protein [Bacteroidetes bacterium]|nr:T9SS type A sorting domain-containing protein [Bacteroidota bacterium]